MILTAFLCTVLAVALCAAVYRRIFLALGLDPHHTLLWLGLAEVPLPARETPRRQNLHLVR